MINVLIHQPDAMHRRCFAPRDIERLGRACEVGSTRGSVDQLRERIGRCRVLVTGWDTPAIPDAVLEGAPDLDWVVHAAGSVRHLLSPQVYERGVRVVTCREALAVGVAETTLGMMIAALKMFIPAHELTRRGLWKVGPLECPGFRVRELCDLTVGIVGAGQAGRHLIRLLRSFDVRVIVADPYLSPDDAEQIGVTSKPLDVLFEESDVVSLHAPELPATRRMVGEDQLARMKDGAILINTARGGLIDTAALLDELKRGRITAWLDVTDPEPPPADHPLRRLPNVVLTPHIAGAMSNGCFRMGRMAVDRVLQIAADEPISDEITAERYAVTA